IGVRKALGATRRAILWQFLVEASTLTLVGGAAGMLAGGALAFAVARLTPIPANVPGWSIVAALVASALTGVGFGLYPASRAARGSDRRPERVPGPARPDPVRLHRRRGLEEDPAPPHHRARGHRVRRAGRSRRAGHRAAVGLAHADGRRPMAQPHRGRRLRLRGDDPLRRGAGLSVRRGRAA